MPSTISSVVPVYVATNEKNGGASSIQLNDYADGPTAATASNQGYIGASVKHQ